MDVVPLRWHVNWSDVRVPNPDSAAWPGAARPTPWHPGVPRVAALLIAAGVGWVTWQVGPSWWWWVLLVPVGVLTLLAALGSALPAPTPAALLPDARSLAERREYLIRGEDLGAAPAAGLDALALTAQTTIRGGAGGHAREWVPETVLAAAMWDTAVRVRAAAEIVAANKTLRRESRSVVSLGGLRYRRHPADAAALDAAGTRVTRVADELVADAGQLRDAAARVAGATVGDSTVKRVARPVDRAKVSRRDDPVRLVWELVTARADAEITALDRTGDGPGVTGEPHSSRWWRR